MFSNGGDDNGDPLRRIGIDEGARRALGTQTERAYWIQSQAHAERCRTPELNTKVAFPTTPFIHSLRDVLEASQVANDATAITAAQHHIESIQETLRDRTASQGSDTRHSHDRMRAVDHTLQSHTGLMWEGPVYAWRVVPHLPAEVTVPVGTGNQTTIEDVLNPSGVVPNPRLHDPELRPKRRRGDWD